VAHLPKGTKARARDTYHSDVARRTECADASREFQVSRLVEVKGQREVGAIQKSSNDHQRLLKADDCFRQGLEYLRDCEHSEKSLPLIAATRRLREQLAKAIEDGLPRTPGAETK